MCSFTENRWFAMKFILINTKTKKSSVENTGRKALKHNDGIRSGKSVGDT